MDTDRAAFSPWRSAWIGGLIGLVAGGLTALAVEWGGSSASSAAPAWALTTGWILTIIGGAAVVAIGGAAFRADPPGRRADPRGRDTLPSWWALDPKQRRALVRQLRRDEPAGAADRSLLLAAARMMSGQRWLIALNAAMVCLVAGQAALHPEPAILIIFIGVVVLAVAFSLLLLRRVRIADAYLRAHSSSGELSR